MLDGVYDKIHHGKLSKKLCPRCGRKLVVNTYGRHWCESPSCDWSEPRVACVRRKNV